MFLFLVWFSSCSILFWENVGRLHILPRRDIHLKRAVILSSTSNFFATICQKVPKFNLPLRFFACVVQSNRPFRNHVVYFDHD